MLMVYFIVIGALLVFALTAVLVMLFMKGKE